MKRFGLAVPDTLTGIKALRNLGGEIRGELAFLEDEQEITLEQVGKMLFKNAYLNPLTMIESLELGEEEIHFEIGTYNSTWEYIFFGLERQGEVMVAFVQCDDSDLTTYNQCVAFDWAEVEPICRTMEELAAAITGTSLDKYKEANLRWYNDHK